LVNELLSRIREQDREIRDLERDKEELEVSARRDASAFEKEKVALEEDVKKQILSLKELEEKLARQGTAYTEAREAHLKAIEGANASRLEDAKYNQTLTSLVRKADEPYKAELAANEQKCKDQGETIKRLEEEINRMKETMANSDGQPSMILSSETSVVDKALREKVADWVDSLERVRELQTESADHSRKYRDALEKEHIENISEARLKLLEKKFNRAKEDCTEAEEEHRLHEKELHEHHKQHKKGGTRQSSVGSNNSGYTEGTTPGSESTGITVPSIETLETVCPFCNMSWKRAGPS
jgi:hypothetical protein